MSGVLLGIGLAVAWTANEILSREDWELRYIGKPSAVMRAASCVAGCASLWLAALLGRELFP